MLLAKQCVLSIGDVLNRASVLGSLIWGRCEELRKSGCTYTYCQIIWLNVMVRNSFYICMNKFCVTVQGCVLIDDIAFFVNL
jgi:hypothetical protein